MGDTVYHIMCKNEAVADVFLSEDKKTIRFEKFKPDGMYQPFSGSNLTLDRFYRFLKDRCYEDGRADLPEILEAAGLPDNNPYAWVKISHGVTWEDYFWIRFDGEDIKWEDVRVRA